jgi:hypothetical protein
MRLVRLGRIFELKYGMRSEAAIPLSEDRIVMEVKRDVLDAYRNYFSRSAKDSMFQFAADTGEPMSVELTYKMDKLVKDIDKMTPDKLIKILNDLIGIMYKMKTDPTKSVRQAIADALPAGTVSQRNARDRALVKFERSLYNAFPALQKAAVKLQVLVPDEAVHGGEIERQRGEITKQQLIDFVLSSSPFKSYGLTSLDIVEQFLSDSELKHKLTTLINAIKRGHAPVDGSEVHTLAKQIKKKLDERGKTNLPILERPELPPINPKQKG